MHYITTIVGRRMIVLRIQLSIGNGQQRHKIERVVRYSTIFGNDFVLQRQDRAPSPETASINSKCFSISYFCTNHLAVLVLFLSLSFVNDGDVARHVHVKFGPLAQLEWGS